MINEHEFVDKMHLAKYDWEDSHLVILIRLPKMSIS